MNETKIDSILNNQKHKVVLGIIRQPKKRKAIHHFGQALAWVGPGIVLFILGMSTEKIEFYIASFVILLTFIVIHVLVHLDFIKTMWEITEAVENEINKNDSQP